MMIYKNNRLISNFGQYITPVIAVLCFISFHTAPLVASEDKSWLVILGSFPSEREGEAYGRKTWLTTRSFNANVITSRDQASIPSGLYVVALGPFERSRALTELNRVKPYITDAYIKGGYTLQARGGNSDEFVKGNIAAPRMSTQNSQTMSSNQIISYIIKTYNENACGDRRSLTLRYNSPYLTFYEENPSEFIVLDMSKPIFFMPQTFEGRYRINMVSQKSFARYWEGSTEIFAAISTCLSSEDAAGRVSKALSALRNMSGGTHDKKSDDPFD